VSDDFERDEGSLVVASLGGIAAIVVASLLIPLRDWFGNTNVALVLVGLVVIAAALGGRLAGLITALSAAVSFNFFHTEPYRTLRIDDREDIITVVLIFVVGVAVGEIALLRQRAAATAKQRAIATKDLARAVELLASGTAITETWACVRDALVTELGLAGASYRSGPVVSEAPVIERGGTLVPSPSRFTDTGFELPPRTCVPVGGRGAQLGHLVLEPTPGHGVTREQRRLAVALADVLAAALDRAGPVTTLS
jgi:K+-sensing histidine kinase KdpD